MIITALIVTYNRLDKLKECVKSTKNANFETIVIVDNASSDGTSEWLKSIENDQIKIVTSPENTGGAGGFKLGLKFINDNIKGDWIALYDDDAYPDENLVSSFHAINKSGYSAFSCRVVDRNGQICKMNLPFRKLPENFQQDLHYLFNTGYYQSVPNQEGECQTLSFVGTILKQEIISDTLNYLHEDLFIYFDDLYYSCHLNQAGFKFLYCPDLVFTHDVSNNNSFIYPEWKVYYLIRNLLLSRKVFSANKPFTSLGILLRLVKYLIMLHKQPNKLTYFKLYARGIRDGLFGLKGKRF